MSEINNTIKKLESLLPETLGRDRHVLRRDLMRARRSGTKGSSEKTGKKLLNLEKKIKASIKKRTRRKENLPDISLNPDLPITARKDDIINAILKNRVLIISGETGSGKTTQIPKLCLAAGRGINGKIGCTQPRRIAATTVSVRIAEELGEEIGKSVGYKIRFKDQTSDNSYIKIMTDGILLAETQGDPYLNEYDTIIVDEAHERSLNIDFVLGILKALLRKRSDLKLIVTSATIDTEKFSKAFDNAPVIEVSGRMYPVKVKYFQPNQKSEDSDEQTHVEMAVRAVEKLHQESPYGGDILVFMPTEQDIRETCEFLEGRNLTGVTVLPLYARLSGSGQSRVFSSIRGRKIIVATNVAETSITIPGIKYVIDTGLARISQYLPGSRTTALPVVPISKSSADQRKGRCGRVANGVCIRLFSEDDFDDRPLFTPPEILRSNLAEVILRMTALRLGDIENFPFIDRPALKNIRDGFNLLTELGAITKKPATKKSENRFSLTEKGRLMARMPIDPRLSRMLIQAQAEGCVEEMAVIASVLSIRDPRERPAEKQAEADQAQAVFSDPTSDFTTLLNIWRKYHDIREKEKTTGKIKKFCKGHFLSFRRMREWRDIHAQITGELRDSGIQEFRDSGIEEFRNSGIQELKASPSVPQSSNPSIPKSLNPSIPKSLNPSIPKSLNSSIHKSVLSGFLSNIAVKKDKNIFQAAKGKEVMIFPGSGLFNKAGTWIVAAEMVETSRVFARTAANIDPDWLEPLGKDQCKYTYIHPHWERNRGEVVAYEQVSLFGLIIVPKRPVSYGRINPEEASDIFIYNALIQGDVKKPFAFMNHNRKLTDEVRDMEDRVRRRDILISENDMYQFYKERLENVYDLRTLEKFLKKKGTDSFLRMRKQDLFVYSPDEKELSLYPETITLGSNTFKCEYNFEPGKNDDGVTVRISSALAPSVPSESLDWVVPGLLREKITALIKGLSKSYRRKLVPVANTVDIIMNEIESQSRQDEVRNPESALITTLSNFVHQRFGVDIPASAWPADSLPDHLRMRISLTGPGGKEFCAGRDKSILNSQVRIPESAFRDEFEPARKKWERTGIVAWDFEDLPDTADILGKNGNKCRAYPGLEPDERCVSLRLFLNRNDALASHKKGVVRLFAIHFSKDMKFLKKNLALFGETERQAEYFGGPGIFEKRMYESVLNDLFCRNIRTKKEFYAHAESAGPVILETGKNKLNSVKGVLKACHEFRSEIYALEQANKANKNAMSLFAELREELARLVPDTFMELYDTGRFVHLERYIKAMTIRAQRFLVNFEKDHMRAEQVRVYKESLDKLLKELSPSASDEKRAATEEYFWLIEEFKVSLFAQELKTPVPVSKKRLDNKLREIEKMV